MAYHSKHHNANSDCLSVCGYARVFVYAYMMIRQKSPMTSQSSQIRQTIAKQQHKNNVSFIYIICMYTYIQKAATAPTAAAAATAHCSKCEKNKKNPHITVPHRTVLILADKERAPDSAHTDMCVFLFLCARVHVCVYG